MPLPGQEQCGCARPGLQGKAVVPTLPLASNASVGKLPRRSWARSLLPSTEGEVGPVQPGHVPADDSRLTSDRGVGPTQNGCGMILCTIGAGCWAKRRAVRGVSCYPIRAEASCCTWRRMKGHAPRRGRSLFVRATFETWVSSGKSLNSPLSDFPAKTGAKLKKMAQSGIETIRVPPWLSILPWHRD